MRIDFDHDLAPDGSILGTHFIETDNPALVATLAAIKGNAAAQAQAGYAHVSQHKLAQPGETRWQFILRQVNSPTGPANLKALNLT